MPGSRHVSPAAVSQTRAGWRARATDPMVSAVIALGITQITAWGTSYYCLGVLAAPIAQDTGWNRGFVFLGFTVALLTMPLHWFGLARRENQDVVAAGTGATATSVDGPPLEGRARSVAIVLFALIMSLNGFVFGVISVQLVSLLEAAGLVTAVAVWVASMKGVAQFAGRVVEIVFARNLRAITVGRIAVGVLPPSLLLLLLGTGSLPIVVAFTLLMGAPRRGSSRSSAARSR